MKLPFTITIRQKLVLGYAVIIFSVLVISLYAIIQLNRLDTLINNAVTIDSKILKGAENLKVYLLVQISHEKKFVITGDPVFKELFAENAKEFNATLTAMEALSDSETIKEMAAVIREIYTSYTGMVSRKNVDDSPDADTGGEKKRDEMVAFISDSLDKLYEMSQSALNKKMVTSQEISRKGTRLAVLITLLTVFCGSGFAYLIARSIYTPLQQLKEITHYISRGDFGKKINITSQDEIGELSDSFNIMCDHLRELDRLKSDFISNVTHDLKTPLASITEANQLLLDGAAGGVSPQQQHLLTIIKEDSARLIKLVETIIDLSKMESGILSYDLKLADISLLIRETMESVSLLSRSKNIQMAFTPDDSIPAILIDDEKMTQALINLLSNAIKFTPAGGTVSIKIARTKEALGSHAGPAFELQKPVLISITDTGVGITRQDLPRIFDKFYRGRTGTTTKGSGLGLTIAHHIIQAHGGYIWAESLPGTGSTFY
ncbi:MAG: HAMP domain-containing sensor histidine kinase, partial [Pseudomonadota bacterium]